MLRQLHRPIRESLLCWTVNIVFVWFGGISKNVLPYSQPGNAKINTPVNLSVKTEYLHGFGQKSTSWFKKLRIAVGWVALSNQISGMGWIRLVWRLDGLGSKKWTQTPSLVFNLCCALRKEETQSLYCPLTVINFLFHRGTTTLHFVSATDN